MNQIEIIARGICVKDDKILLAYFKEKEYYFLPGGHVEFGESVFKTLEREIFEETGLSAQVRDLAFVFEHTWNDEEKIVHELNYVLMYDLNQAPPTIRSKVGHLEFVWIPLEQFTDLSFLPSEIKRLVSDILRGDRKTTFFSTIK